MRTAWTWIACIAIGIVVLGLIQRCESAPLDTHVVDSLRAHGAQLEQVNVQLRLDAQALSVERDAILHQRDSLRVASQARTAQIVVKRAQLPAPAVVPDSMVRQLYAQTLAVLDTALVELQLKDDIIRTDSVAWARDQEHDLKLLAQIDNITGQRDDAKQEAVTWERLYRREKTRCGRTCGAIVGVVATLAVGWAVR